MAVAVMANHVHIAVGLLGLANLAAVLPDTIAPYVGTTTSAQRFGVDEFLRRVADREGVDLETARQIMRLLRSIADDTAVLRQEAAVHEGMALQPGEGGGELQDEEPEEAHAGMAVVGAA